MQRLDCEAVRLNSTDYSSDFSSLKSKGACVLGTTSADGSHDRITKYNYDPVTGLLTSTISAYGTASARTDVTKVYDTSTATSTGTLSYVEDANGNRTSYFYDTFNRLIKTCYPLVGSTHSSSTTDCEQTAYRTTTIPGANQVGTLVNSVTLRNGSPTISFGYDTIGRLNAKTGAVSEGFTYDSYGKC